MNEQQSTKDHADTETAVSAAEGLLRAALPQLLPGMDLTQREARAASLIGQIQTDIERDWNGVPKIQREESLARGKALRKAISRKQHVPGT